MTNRVLLDVNVLLALAWDGHVHHERAHEKFAEVTAWCTSAITEIGLLRMLLTEAVVGERIHAGDALRMLGAIRATPGWGWLADDLSPMTWTVADGVLLGRRQVTDLHLVNLAASNDCVLGTFDAGLQRSLSPSQRWLVDVWA